MERGGTNWLKIAASCATLAAPLSIIAFVVAVVVVSASLSNVDLRSLYPTLLLFVLSVTVYLFQFRSVQPLF